MSSLIIVKACINYFCLQAPFSLSEYTEGSHFIFGTATVWFYKANIFSRLSCSHETTTEGDAFLPAVLGLVVWRKMYGSLSWCLHGPLAMVFVLSRDFRCMSNMSNMHQGLSEWWISSIQFAFSRHIQCLLQKLKFLIVPFLCGIGLYQGIFVNTDKNGSLALILDLRRLLIKLNSLAYTDHAMWNNCLSLFPICGKQALTNRIEMILFYFSFCSLILIYFIVLPLLPFTFDAETCRWPGFHTNTLFSL